MLASLSRFDALLGDLLDAETDPADEPPCITKKPVNRRGDVWLLDRHRLLCADARQRSHFGKLMSGDLAAMAFADPPYNVQSGPYQEVEHPCSCVCLTT
jgi:hypothetical protein